MLKKLLLTVALLSSTYGSDTHLVDPNFSILANRDEVLVINENEVVIKYNELEPDVLHRLTQSHVSDALNSNDIDVLINALKNYTAEIWCARWGVTPEQDAVLLSQVFWNRVAAMVQTLKAIVNLPTEVMDAESFICFNQQYAKLTNFSAEYDHADTSSFTTARYVKELPLIEAFENTYYPLALIETPILNDPLPSDAPIPKDVSTQVSVTHGMRIPSKL